MLLRILCCVLALYWLPVSASEIYKERDKNGNITYTDKPTSEKSEKVILPPINTVPSQPGIADNSGSPDRQEGAQPYQIEIMSPRNNAMISPEQRDLAIAVNMNQELQADHWLIYYMNGELLEETKSTSIVIREVPRGARTFSVEVVARNGESLAKAPSVTVNVMRPIVKPKPTPAPGPKP